MKRPCSRFLSGGFTLAEMLVSVVVFVFVMTLAFNTLLASTTIRKAAVARIDIFQNGRTTLDLISRELRTATLRQTDVRFTQDEILAGVTTERAGINQRGRFILNDWPPPKDEASMFGLNPADTNIYRGNGLDDDVDGQTDEEAFDGLDNDGDGEQESPIHPLLGVAMADGLDNNEDGLVDEGIDEDIFYPRDMVNFLALVDIGQGADLQEVGYAIDTRTARDLLRRASFKISQLELQAAGITPDPRVQVDGRYATAIDYLTAVADGDTGGLTPDPNTGVIAPWFDPVNVENPPRQDPDRIQDIVEALALNIVGFDCKAYYYDYAIAEENAARRFTGGRTFQKTTKNFTSLDESPDLDNAPEEFFSPYSFPILNWDSSIENVAELPYRFNAGNLPILPNGADDMAVVPGSELFDPDEFPQELLVTAMDKTDGLPRLVEVTIFIEDQNRTLDDAVKLSTRVFLPFVTGDE
jgi:type II secretory pathway pseudopilin PulG